MDRATLERRLHEALKEFYEKQGMEVTEELDFALGAQAEFLAAMVAAEFCS